jgi:hypothetical protein
MADQKNPCGCGCGSSKQKEIKPMEIVKKEQADKKNPKKS